MEYWIIDNFREKKYLRVAIYFLSCVILFFTLYYIVSDTAQDNNNVYYYNDGFVNSVNILYLIFLTITFLIFLYKILFELKIIKFEIQKVNNLILLVSVGFLVALLFWYEFNFVISFYHGDVKLISGYLIGSSILSSMFVTMLLFNKIKNITVLFFIFITLEYVLFEFLVAFIAKYVDIISIIY